MLDFLLEYKGILLQGIGDTLYMTLVATVFAYVLGLPLGVLLTVTKKGGIMQAHWFNTAFGWLINIIRSLPFLILMIFLFPFTRLITGTSIGATAAIVPLVVSASPFVARMVETSLEEVDSGVIEAAQGMGATNFQIITRVMIRESIPSLIRGLSISTITILGYTAITGAVGAGGLGDIAFRYGYNRYDKAVMYTTIILLVVIVCIIQGVFNILAKKLDKRNR